ncbi:MAG: hypothetical protein HRT69_15685 [Flavobacteriaceae bacterium]|nr:hypothetical protein [Flavobacteriaceae bacterium]
MVHYTDEEFIDTESVLIGEKELSPELIELSKWISDEFKIDVINLIVDYLSHLNRNRLQIITRTSKDACKFKESENWVGNFDKKKQEIVAQKYLEIVEHQKTKNKGFLSLLKKNDFPASKKLFVCASAFNPIAREAIVAEINGAKLEQFKKDINLSELWEIQTGYGGAHFFFYTNEQVNNIKDSSIYLKLKKDFLKIVKKHDKYGLLSDENFRIHIDSKENFDDNYESNWYYYYK